ncbi:MAG TPA: RHS repeat-associated core domain-containing protein, partial [Thermoanaerobaculia bacterium]|nr:RHS repeat-associated core domain-containing protein [Thermoanaerobaculia bacterium]
GLFLHRSYHRAAKTLPPAAASDGNFYVFYFAGRPVATLDKVTQGATTTSTLRYLSTDHLGTPILLTSTTGAQVWQGGFEPFGTDFSSSPTILRFAGQWSDSTWNGTKGYGTYYNVNRWYKDGRGRYISRDLVVWKTLPNPYIYALDDPLLYTDSLGLAPVHNGSGVPIPYKPEEAPPGTIRLCLPGATCDADGVYPPTCNNYPIKIVNGCTAQIGPSGTMVVLCPLINWHPRSPLESSPAAGQAILGGRTNDDFHVKHPDWRRPNGKLFCGCDPNHPDSGPPPEVPPMTILP